MVKNFDLTSSKFVTLVLDTAKKSSLAHKWRQKRLKLLMVWNKTSTTNLLPASRLRKYDIKSELPPAKSAHLVA